MLVNNFKALISWGTGDDTVKLVNGEEVTRQNILSYSTSHQQHGHQKLGGLCFNYDITPDVNTFTEEQSQFQFDFLSARTKSQYENGLILFVGSGMTPPSAEDYKLENALNLQVNNQVCSHNATNLTTVIRTFQNNTEENVTINEVGLYVFRTCFYDQWSTYHYQYPMLVGRKVLSSPITLAPNEMIPIQYQIKLDNFTFTDGE